MASAFWGGFADTMLEERRNAEEKRRALEDYKKKKEIDLSFETTDVEAEDAAGNPVLRKVNIKGETVGERRLTSAEVERRMEQKRLIAAQLKSTEARAEVDGKQAEYFEEDRKFKMDDRKQAQIDRDQDRELRRENMRASQASRANANASTALLAEQRAMALEERAEARNPRTIARQAELEAAKQLNDLGATPAARQRALTTFKGNMNRVLQNPDLDDATKRAQIQSMLSSFSAHTSPVARDKTTEAGVGSGLVPLPTK
jgi:hypothetical protein